MKKMTDLMTRPNLGNVLVEELRKIDVTTFDDLVEVGSVEAFLRIKGNCGKGCFNMLYALEGAIQGIRWHSLTKEERERVKNEYLRVVHQ